MSQIATALAKAKERPATQAPFMAAGSVNRHSLPVKRRVPVNLAWGALLGVSVVCAGLLVWWTEFGNKPLPVSTGTVAALTGNGPASSATAAGSPMTVSKPDQLTPALNARASRNEAAVRDLNISAVLPGAEPRIMANGRIYGVGDIVLPPEISFAGTDNGKLVFADSYGNRFTRRY